MLFGAKIPIFTNDMANFCSKRLKTKHPSWKWWQPLECSKIEMAEAELQLGSTAKSMI